MNWFLAGTWTTPNDDTANYHRGRGKGGDWVFKRPHEGGKRSAPKRRGLNRKPTHDRRPPTKQTLNAERMRAFSNCAEQGDIGGNRRPGHQPPSFGILGRPTFEDLL